MTILFAALHESAIGTKRTSLLHRTCPLLGVKRTCRSPRAAPVHRDTQVDCLTLANRTSLVSRGALWPHPLWNGKTNPESATDNCGP